jgi:hypothetical protein
MVPSGSLLDNLTSGSKILNKIALILSDTIESVDVIGDVDSDSEDAWNAVVTM